MLFLRRNCTLYRLKYKVNITNTNTGKPKHLCESLYCDICFTAVVWNQTWSMYKVCLCLSKDLKEWAMRIHRGRRAFRQREQSTKAPSVLTVLFTGAEWAWERGESAESREDWRARAFVMTSALLWMDRKATRGTGGEEWCDLTCRCREPF